MAPALVHVVEVLLDVSVRAAPTAEAEFERREEDVTVRGAAAGGADGGRRQRKNCARWTAARRGEAGMALSAGLSHTHYVFTRMSIADTG